MMKRLVLIFLLSALCGCGTVSPNPILDLVATSDSSIPKQYDQSKGWNLFPIRNSSGVITGEVLTKNAHNRYNALILTYKLQFQEKYQVLLNVDSGITPYKDKFENKLFLIDVEHYEYFQRLSGWSKDGKPSDSQWEEDKKKVGPVL